jgi:acetyl esterase
MNLGNNRLTLDRGKEMNVHLEKHTGKFIQTLLAQGGPPLYTLSVTDARKVLETLQSQPVVKLPVQIEDLLLPCGPKGRVSVRIVRPLNGSEDLPIVIYCHGGGWILGSHQTHDRLIREIACGAHAAVVFINYTPSPEACFPIPVEEAYAATDYIAKHAQNFKLDPSRLAIVGDSVGGNMATVVALLAKERGGPKIDYQVLFYPVTDANFNTGSYREFADGPWLTKSAMQWFWNAYAPTLSDRKKYTACPLLASLDQLRNLPPTLLVTDEHDVLRDEGEAYAHKLMQAGVDVTVVRYLGTIHDFVLINALSQTPATRSAIALAISSLQKQFNRQCSKMKKTG